MKSIKKGYSLAELSVVVLIVSMVAYLVVPIS
ncbi:prepilin-type N-terminal cleavage/methylation domain-containing protein [Neisseria sp.]